MRPRTLIGGLIGILAILTMAPARGHDVLQAYLQHRASFSLGTNGLDVVVALTFFEDWSEQELRRMDTNHDQRITAQETQGYLARLKPGLIDGIRLLVDCKPVDLVLLCDPELDLGGTDAVGPAHHRLQLTFFARPPVPLKPGVELVLEDSLWPQAPALTAVQAVGRHGYQLKAGEAEAPRPGPTRRGEAHRFSARCLAVPAVPTAKSNPSAGQPVPQPTTQAPSADVTRAPTPQTRADP